MNPFKGRHFQRNIILWAVRWYCKYGISYRELQEMLAERGVSVDHTPRFTAGFNIMRLRWKNGCDGTGETVQGSAPGISMKLISKRMADGLTCTRLFTAKAAPSIFISLRAVTAKLHIVFSERF